MAVLDDVNKPFIPIEGLTGNDKIIQAMAALSTGIEELCGTAALLHSRLQPVLSPRSPHDELSHGGNEPSRSELSKYLCGMEDKVGGLKVLLADIINRLEI